MPDLSLTLNVDPWGYQKLVLRQGVLEHRLGHRVSRSEALRRVCRRLRFTDEQEAAFRDAVLDQVAQRDPAARDELTED